MSVDPKAYELAQHLLGDFFTEKQKMQLAERFQITCEDFVRNLAMSDEGEWKKGVLILYPEYYNAPDRVQGALILANAAVTIEQVETWSPEQRKAAAEWALSTHFHAADEDITVPPRPEFLG